MLPDVDDLFFQKIYLQKAFIKDSSDENGANSRCTNAWSTAKHIIYRL
jgi:hypothetical protein